MPEMSVKTGKSDRAPYIKIYQKTDEMSCFLFNTLVKEIAYHLDAFTNNIDL